MEVDQVPGVGLEALQIEYRDVLLHQRAGDEAGAGRLLCFDRCDATLGICLDSRHKLESKRGGEFSELVTEKSNDSSFEISGIGL